MKNLSIIIFCIFFTSILSCRKCEECFLIEENTSTGNIKETSQGKFCGSKKIKAQEEKNWICPDNNFNCYTECR